MKISFMTGSVVLAAVLVRCSTTVQNDQSEVRTTASRARSFSTKGDFDRLLINEKVPAFRAKTIAGLPVDSSYFSHKITLINFMYIGCGPCMEEAPVLNRLYNKVRSPHFQMLCIAPQTPRQMSAYQLDKPTAYKTKRLSIPPGSIPYDIIAECSTTDVLGKPSGPECRAISRKFLVSGYPVTVLVDHTGIIRYRHTGFDARNPPDFEDEIGRLLKKAAL